MTMNTYVASRPALEEAAAALFNVLKSGAVKAAARQQFKLADVAEAHRALEGRQTKGATVLIP
jgi:NADPH2:quinone reductase